ncbi:MAG: hypothetical protein EZS28_036563 [Streblomastix strix]|uniref:Tyr recombinase domain-containing protein n=1 Tax=Streblomastix strix TaxID=222440 RepID=A0A5J4UCI7_9EUKA|nr:MAG: hypothetical protein EZS28_036563 [Streblomastix strix]
MSVCLFRPNEIAEIRLKFSNVNKTENQASLGLAPKQANAIETYEVYETDNEKLSPKLAIYEWIDRLKKQFPKATTELAKQGISERDLATFTHHSQNSRIVQQYYIFASSIKANDIARNKEGIPQKTEGSNKRNDAEGGLERIQ